MTFSPRANTPINWIHDTLPPCYKFKSISDSLLKFPSFRQRDRQQNPGQAPRKGYSTLQLASRSHYPGSLYKQNTTKIEHCGVCSPATQITVRSSCLHTVTTALQRQLTMKASSSLLLELFLFAGTFS